MKVPPYEIECFLTEPHAPHLWGFYQNKDGLQCSGAGT